MAQFPYIHDHIPPLESGGVIARKGFLFQDHVAAQYCIQALTDSDLNEVRCESQDDITLVWLASGQYVAEYIQVKSNELNQLWSVAKVCEQESSETGTSSASKAKSGTSILERLIANDRFAESARFRIVTRRDVNNDLRILTHSPTAHVRQSCVNEYQNLCAKIKEKLTTLLSPKGNDSFYFVSNAYWEVVHSTEVLEEKNCGSLRRYVESKGVLLVISQIREIYQHIVQKVQDAASADWKIDPDAKKIKTDDFRLWVDNLIQRVKEAIVTNASEMAQEKMEDAELPTDYIIAAMSAIQYYREESLSSKYFEPTDRRLIEQEVWAELNDLRSQFDTGAITDSTTEFHSRCLSRLKELQAELPVTPKPTLSFLHGCMYYITGRCGHRFRRLNS